jgi:tripartite-type tricarboxylate transporter receptor subunit TctC
LIELSNTLGRWIAAPPSIADDDLAILRAAFDKVVADPDFLAEAKTQKLEIDPLGGAQVQEKLTALLARKQQLRGSLAAALTCGRRRADGARSC